MSQTNPIQLRFDQLVEKWTLAINTPEVKIVRIHAQHDEKSFINDFFEYMLALDTQQQDLVFLTETPWSNKEDFGKKLVEEIAETINIWNTAKKPENLPNAKVEWSPIYKISKIEDNPAQLFIDNINSLAKKIVPDKSTIVSFVIKMPNASSDAAKWLQNVLETDLESHVRIGITDSNTSPLFKKLASHNSKKVFTLFPNIDIDGAVEEMAALGNPQEPENPFRYHLTCLMNGIKQRNQKKVSENARFCLDIAVENINKNPLWLSQIVVVYTSLYNDQIGYKNYKKALFFAAKAVESATLAIGRIPPETAYRLLGQTLLGRGTIYHLLKKNHEAAADFELAAKAYLKCKDYLMYIESIRLYAEMADKIGQGTKANEAIVNAFNMVDNIPKETAVNSTFPWLAKILYNRNSRDKLITDKQIEEKLTPLFGADWKNIINNFGKVPA